MSSFLIIFILLLLLSGFFLVKVFNNMICSAKILTSCKTTTRTIKMIITKATLS